MTTEDQIWDVIKNDYARRYLVEDARINRKLQNIEIQFRAESRNAERARIFASYRILAMESADERVELSFSICRDIWKEQGGTESRLFFRAVFLHCFARLFSDLRFHALTQTRIAGSAAEVGTFESWRKALSDLERAWGARLETEAINAERSTALGATEPTPIDTTKQGEVKPSKARRKKFNETEIRASYQKIQRLHRDYSELKIAAEVAKKMGCSISTVKKKIK